MFRFLSKKALASALLVGVAGLFETSSAQAQFPIFYGGQVLTPFGQRGSDGSYLNRRPFRANRGMRGYTYPQAVQQPRTYQTPAPAYRYPPINTYPSGTSYAAPGTYSSGYAGAPYGYSYGMSYPRYSMGGWR